MKLIICFLLASTLSTSIGAKELLYTISDLQALEAQKSYDEFFKHALDIRPSQRDSQWRNMVSDMAVGFVEFKLKREDFKPTTWQRFESMSNWPVLQTDEFYQTKRRGYFSKYIQQCVSSLKRDKSECTQEIKKYWLNSFKNLDMGIELAEIIQRENLDFKIWPLINKAPKSDLSHFYCQKPLIQNHLLTHLIQPLKSETKSFDLKEHLDQSLNQKCWEKLTPELKERLFSSRSDQLIKDYLYRLLTTKKELSTQEEDLFLMTYLLEGPIVGETFNRAWNRVAKISEDYERRSDVFKKLQKIDPLPGSLFSSANTKKRDVVMKHFHQHFPEYFPYYAKTCVDYMSGEQSFPNGNPTVQCPDFFEVTGRKDWVQQEIKIQYSGLKK